MKQALQERIRDLASEYSKQVFHSANRLLSDQHLAEDVTQEVFLKLFQKPEHTLDQVSQWSAYLKTMAIRGAIDHLRKNKRLAEDSFDQSKETGANKSQQPFEQLLKDRDLKRFKFALTQLPSQDSEIYCLRYVEGYSYKEIATLLNISSNLVGVSIHRAHQKIISILGQSQALGDYYEI